MARSLVLRDPIHGDIDLTPAHTALLDTREMQRLRGIKQLGTAYLVYPGCTHTRFEHSLGTLASARNIMAALRRSNHVVSAENEELVSVAALLHDIGHIPFGHTLEDERSLLPRHDTAGRVTAALGAGEVGEVLANLGLIAEISQLLTSGGDWRAQIVASSVDADLLDYLRRDSFYAGISQDYDDRIYRYFCIADGQLALNLAKHGMDRPDARSEVLHLLRMRYFLTERVYLHHAKVAAGVMLSKAVELCLEKGATQSFFTTLTDESLIAWLAGDWGEACHPVAAELACGIRNRRLYKRAYGLSGVTLQRSEQAAFNLLQQSGEERKRVECNIAARAGVTESDVLVHCTGELPFRELSIPAYTRHGLHRLNAPPQGVARTPDILALASDYQALWRLWVFAPAKHREAVGRAAQAEFCYINELRR